MTRFDADRFPWEDLPPTWHDPQTPAGEPSPVPGRPRDANRDSRFLRDVLSYVVVVGGLIVLAQVMGWMLGAVQAP